MPLPYAAIEALRFLGCCMLAGAIAGTLYAAVSGA